MPGPIVQLEGVHKTYSMGHTALHVLKGVDMAIEPGELVSIMGSSGSGKSTLLNIIGLLDRHDAGEYRLDGQPMQRLSEKRAALHRSRSLGFVFQSFNLIPFKTAAENVALPLYYRGVGRRKRNRQALEYLEKVGLLDWAEHLPAEMSGGEQQRVAIARSLVTNPRVILADEPTGALDTSTSFDVLEILRSINRTGVTVVVVTHEHDIAEMTDRVIHLKDGLIENGQIRAVHV